MNEMPNSVPPSEGLSELSTVLPSHEACVAVVAAVADTDVVVGPSTFTTPGQISEGWQ